MTSIQFFLVKSKYHLPRGKNEYLMSKDVCIECLTKYIIVCVIFNSDSATFEKER